MCNMLYSSILLYFDYSRSMCSDKADQMGKGSTNTYTHSENYYCYYCQFVDLCCETGDSNGWCTGATMYRWNNGTLERERERKRNATDRRDCHRRIQILLTREYHQDALIHIYTYIYIYII